MWFILIAPPAYIYQDFTCKLKYKKYSLILARSRTINHINSINHYQISLSGHINNLHNTCFWSLVQEGNLTPQEADKRIKVHVFKLRISELTFVIFGVGVFHMFRFPSPIYTIFDPVMHPTPGGGTHIYVQYRYVPR